MSRSTARIGKEFGLALALSGSPTSAPYIYLGHEREICLRPKASFIPERQKEIRVSELIVSLRNHHHEMNPWSGFAPIRSQRLSHVVHIALMKACISCRSVGHKHTWGSMVRIMDFSHLWSEGLAVQIRPKVRCHCLVAHHFWSHGSLRVATSWWC